MKKFLNLFLVVGVVLCLFSFMGHAQSVSPSPNSISVSLDHATSAIPSSLPAGWIMLITFVVTELGAHGVPTAKPISWFLAISAILESLILLLTKVKGLTDTLGNSLQNTSAS